jgi:large subunit ribosomal protein L25
MEVGKLTVEFRKDQGKGAARRLRATGKVPGVCYGKGVEPLALALDPKALKRALDPQKRQNTVISMTVTGAGADRVLTVMLKDYQYHAIRHDVEHVDLIAIDPSKDVRVSVPLVLVGKAKGIVDGGQLHTVLRELAIVCRPDLIPAKLEGDVSNLGMGDVLHVSDIKLPEGVKAAVAPTDAVASVVAPHEEKEVKPAEAVAEGAAAPAAGQAAAPAGAAGGDKKAEAKPAAGGKEAAKK